MDQQQLTFHQRISAEEALKWIAGLPDFRTLPGGLEYWGEVRDRLQAMHHYGTTDGKPGVESVKPQSVDSSKPGFVMPDDWHWRKVDAIGVRYIAYGLRLIGWDASYQTDEPYCVIGNDGRTLWTGHVRFTDVDWSDDDTEETC